MLKNNTVIELLKQNEFNHKLKPLNETNSERDLSVCIKASQTVFNNLDENLRKYLIEKQLKIKYITDKDVKSNKLKELDCFSYINLEQFIIYILPPDKFSNIETTKHIIHNLVHEIGHIILNTQCTRSASNTIIKKKLLSFITGSEAAGPVSEYADKYFKGIYGKTHQPKKIYELLLKHQENFAELFRIHFEHILDEKFCKAKFPLPDKFSELFNIFKELIII